MFFTNGCFQRVDVVKLLKPCCDLLYCVTVCIECICNNEVEMHRCEWKGKLVFSLKGFLCLFEVHVFDIRDAETLGNIFLYVTKMMVY